MDVTVIDTQLEITRESLTYAKESFVRIRTVMTPITVCLVDKVANWRERSVGLLLYEGTARDEQRFSRIINKLPGK